VCACLFVHAREYVGGSVMGGNWVCVGHVRCVR